MRSKLLVSLVVAGMVLTACGGDDDADSTDDSAVGAAPDTGASATETSAPGGSTPDASSTQQPADMDPDGVLEAGYDLVGATRGGFTLNTTAEVTSFASLGMFQLIYGGLMRTGPDGTPVPDLAESATLVDDSTIDVELREGLTFHDGSPLAAEAVKTVLEENLTKTDSVPLQKSFLDLETVEVTSPTSLTLTIADGKAPAWYDLSLAGAGAMMYKPGSDFQNPIGAGPMKFVNHQPEQSLTLEKFDGYWDADNINVAGIEFIHAADAQAAMSAVRAGQIDIGAIDPRQVDAAGSGIEVLSEPDPNFLTLLPICKSEEPFSDPAVREALSIAIDREAIDNAIFNGEAVPAWDLFPDGHRLHNPDLDGNRAYDPERARELLTEAGYPDGFSFDWMPFPVGTLPEIAQVIQQQWAEIGVDANIQKTVNYVEDFQVQAQAPMGGVPTPGSAGRAKLEQWSGNTGSNVCGYEDPELEQLITELGSVTSDTDEGVELWHELDAKIAEDTLSIFIVFQPDIHAYSADRVGDVAVTTDIVAVPDIRTLYIKSGS